MLLSSSPEAALGQPKSASPGAAFSKQQLEMIDNTLSIEEHKGLWKEILSEMMLMVGLQYLTNMMLLIPFFVTGTRSIFFNHFLYLSALNF